MKVDEVLPLIVALPSMSQGNFVSCLRANNNEYYSTIGTKHKKIDQYRGTTAGSGEATCNVHILIQADKHQQSPQ